MQSELRNRCEIFVEGLVVFQIAPRDPLIVFRAIADPTHEVFDTRFADFLMVNDFVDEVFRVEVVIHRSRLLQGASGPFGVVILFERLDVGGVKGRENVGSVRNVQGDRRGVFVDVDQRKGPSYLGMNLATRNSPEDLYSLRLLSVLSMTLSPIL